MEVKRRSNLGQGTQQRRQCTASETALEIRFRELYHHWLDGQAAVGLCHILLDQYNPFVHLSGLEFSTPSSIFKASVKLK